ncbi:hypothetical protein C4544_02740 [candidate division WS5 bacterium]|uniref:Uncharacterized protein n=1 Tax=candidate division WS5 bacterium TaxID=2093353 RepID=A0A419DEC5_9BACT|nr:MAG: hypothetical protein C4544_02740 [candidate division WS5 bacterium]
MGIDSGGPVGEGPSDDELIEKNLSFIKYLADLGEGGKCDADYNEEILAPLKKPFVSRPEDRFKVEQRINRHKQDDSNERLKNRHSFSTAFEKSLIILGNLKGVDFFGQNSNFAITSQYDDIINGVDIAAKIGLPDGQEIFFGIDATTTQGRDHLSRKYYKNRERLKGLSEKSESRISKTASVSIKSGLKYWPKRLLYEGGIERERNHSQEMPEITINLIAGLPPKEAIDMIHIAVKALALEQKAKKGTLLEGERENFIRTIKTSSARAEMINQMLSQTEKAIMSFDISDQEKGERLKLLRDHFIDTEDLAETEGATRSIDSGTWELTDFINSNYSVPDEAYFEDTSKASND